MLDLTPARAELDPIEIASRDEIGALQLARLKWTLRHVYDNVPHYWKAFDATGVHPDVPRQIFQPVSQFQQFGHAFFIVGQGIDLRLKLARFSE